MPSIDQIQTNKSVVRRFNKEVIEDGNIATFKELMAPDFVNRSAPPGMPTGPEGMQYFFENILRPALTDLRVDIHDQVAEGDWVTTRKTIQGTHRGELMGVPATNKLVAIEVIDMVRVKDGRYVEHWGITTLVDALARLQSK
jgi:predicted ester cyclase